MPSAYGIGDLGPEAHRFAATLAAAGLKYWQFLPLTPTSTFIGNSPYSSPSAFAGNPLFISPELLLGAGYVSPADLTDSIRRAVCLHQADITLNDGRVNFVAVTEQREHLLKAAFRNLSGQGEVPGRDLENAPAYREFLKRNACWLEDYALFMAIKETLGGTRWQSWPQELKWRDPSALAEWRAAHPEPVKRQKFVQFLFYGQWEQLRAHCRELGVGLVGDLPIYVTEDSADVWSRPDLFKLDENGFPARVAGVPPDYFSASGQRWGNPVYNWPALEREGFDWWIKRLEHNLRLADLLRLDHFRGYCAYWEVPAEEETAVNGQWTPAPGHKLLTAWRERFGRLPLLAENLGVITPDVLELMQEFDLPGMSVLQFGFTDPPGSSDNAPFRCARQSVVYTGTHDNPTGKQWFREASEAERSNFINYRGQDLDADYANEVLMRMALESQAELAVLPMQDVLRLDGWARMNTPAQAENNWAWRLENTNGWLPAEYCACGGQTPGQDAAPALPLDPAEADAPAQGRPDPAESPDAAGRPDCRPGCRPDGQADGPVDGQVDGQADGQADGGKGDQTNGVANGVADGAADGAANSVLPGRSAGLPIPDIFGHVHFLCALYGRLE